MFMNYTANYVWNNCLFKLDYFSNKQNRFGLVSEVGNIVWNA